jgi:hypothetical protein
MTTARALDGATLLDTGEVLVAGFDQNTHRSAELYNPSTGTWKATGSMHYTHINPSLTLLQDGRALIVGGGDEVYNTSTGQRTLT